MQINEFLTEKRSIKDLKPAPYNPRVPNKKLLKILKESILKYGEVDPIVINKNNVIIGGHQRFLVYKEMGVSEITCRVSPELLDEAKEKELNLLLNRNVGEYVEELLAQNFSEDLLKGVGFTNEEIRGIFSLDDNVEGDQEFTKELLEEQNYIVFAFDNVMDWNVIKDKFGIKAVNALDSKNGYEKKGVGRVLDGKILLQMIT